MEENTKVSTGYLIIAGIMKLLWYLFLVAAGICILFFMVCLEASKPRKTNGY